MMVPGQARRLPGRFGYVLRLRRFFRLCVSRVRRGLHARGRFRRLAGRRIVPDSQPHLVSGRVIERDRVFRASGVFQNCERHARILEIVTGNLRNLFYCEHVLVGDVSNDF